MKKNSLFTLIALIASSASLAFGTTATYTNVIKADVPVSFWPLNETSGTLIHDLIGTNNGTVVNGTLGVALGTPGILYGNGITTDTAVYFTNTGTGYISIPYSTNLNTSNFTVEAWLNMPTFPAPGAGVNMNPLGLCNGIGAYGWTWNIQSANGANPTISAWCGKSGSWTAINSGIASQNKWTHYVITYDGTTFKSYTNGVSAGSSASVYRKVNAGNYLFLGDYNNTGASTPDSGRYYLGAMENVAVYNYVLSANQVTNHYFAGTNIPVGGTAPSINTQPVNQTNFVNQTAIFSVAASGTAPLRYQWRGRAVGGGTFTNMIAGGQFSAVTNSTFSISSLTLGNAAEFVVVVTNAFGSITSSVASLTVLTNPVGLTAYQTIIIADDPVAYWPLNETGGTVIHDIAGTNNGTVVNGTLGMGFGLPGVLYSSGVTSDTAIYFTNNASGGGGYINVPYSTNLNTPIFSVEAWLNMPTFPAPGAGVNMCPLSFDSSTGYGWVFNISSANGANPSLSGWCGTGAGWTSVSTGTAIQSKWAYYAMTYDATTFSVYTNGVLAGSSSSVYHLVNAGNPLLIGTYINGTLPDGARYYRGGMENVAVYDYTLTPAQIANHNAFGTNSGAAFIASQPTSQIKYIGDTATFTVSATGVMPLIYRWQAKATNVSTFTNLIVNSQITSVTNTTLSISSLVAANAADFRVIVTNSLGSVTSSVARLTVLTNLLPFITSQPVSQTNTVGQTANFTVSAVGFPPLSYRWQAGKTNSGVFTNVPVSSQTAVVTNTTLSIGNLVTANAGDFRVVLTNLYGSVTSAVARLTVRTNAATNTIKLMCIGDSITDIDVCWWRVDLASNLVNAGFNYLMVGRRQGTLGPVNQRHHEGYSGYTSSQILSMIPTMMAANLPDIAMVHIGANDLSGPYPNKTADNLKLIIQGLQAANPNMTIVVSQIIPCRLCGTIWEYNSLIPQIVHDTQTANSHVVIVDVFDGFIDDVMFDGGTGPHPNAIGGRFMCDIYTPVISSILNGVIPSNPALPPPFPGPTGYRLVSFTQGNYIINFPVATNIAYGTPSNYGGGVDGNGQPLGGGNNVYIFKTNVVGNFSFNNNLGDPDPGFEKFGYVKVAGAIPQGAKPPVAAELVTETSPSPSSKQFQLRVTAEPNQTYTLQMSTDLNSGVWTTVLTTNSLENTSLLLTDPSATNEQRFYRVLTGQ